MEKIALITDSACDLEKDIIEKYNIHVLPFRIIYKNKEYRDGIDITAGEVYDSFNREIPTTSLPSMQDMEELYVKLENEGYTHVIAVTLSTGLSGIYNALKLVSEDHHNIKSFIYDSKSISLGEGILIQSCGEMLAEGKSYDEIVGELPRIKDRTKLYFVVGTLEYLTKGGRIGKVAGTIAELLHIKPIISTDNHGVYYTHSKVRGRKQSLKKLGELGEEILSLKKCKVFIKHGNCEEEAQKVCDALSNHPNVVSIFRGGNISPVSGVHSGPGLVGLVLVEEP